MCQHIISRTNRQCKNKAEPYCHLHQKKSYSIEQLTLELDKLKIIKKEECCICMEDRMEFVTHKDCGNKICKSCVIKSGSTKCPFCRGNIDIKDSDIKELLDFIGEKDKMIKELTIEKLNLRRTIREMENLFGLNS